MTRTTRILPAALLAAAIAVAPATGHAQGQAQPAPQGAAKGDDDHSAHHPSDTQAATAAPAPAAPAAGAQGQPPGMGMGMMGADMGAMMQSMMPMMRGMMAQRMGGSMGMDGPMGMMSPRRVEGRIAFLRTELKITEAQQPAWTAFADALRAEARSMQDMRQRMAAAGAPFPEQADLLVQALAARLEAAGAIASSGRALYAALTDEQRKTADELLAMPMRGM